MDNSIETHDSIEQDISVTETTNTNTDAMSDEDIMSALSDIYGEKEAESEDEQATEEDKDTDDTEPDESDEPANSDDDSEPDETPLEIDDKDFTITVDGEEISVKGQELKNGYMRQAAFTKKTQELAEERKAVSEQRNQMATQLNVLGLNAKADLQKLDDVIRAEGGIDAIKTKYSPEQIKQFAEMYQAAQSRVSQVEGALNDYKKQYQEEAVASIKSIFSDMSKEIAGFNDATVTKMDKYLAANGFSQEDMLGITSRPAWDMIYKSMMYDDAQLRQAKKPPVKEVKAPVKKATNENSMTKVLNRQAKSRGEDNESATIEALSMIFK